MTSACLCYCCCSPTCPQDQGIFSKGRALGCPERNRSRLEVTFISRGGLWLLLLWTTVVPSGEATGSPPGVISSNVLRSSGDVKVDVSRSFQQFVTLENRTSGAKDQAQPVQDWYVHKEGDVDLTLICKLTVKFNKDVPDEDLSIVFNAEWSVRPFNGNPEQRPEGFRKRLMSFAPFAAETCRTIRIYSRKHLMEDGYNQPSHRYPNKTSSVVSQRIESQDSSRTSQLEVECSDRLRLEDLRARDTGVYQCKAHVNISDKSGGGNEEGNHVVDFVQEVGITVKKRDTVTVVTASFLVAVLFLLSLTCFCFKMAGHRFQWQKGRRRGQFVGEEDNHRKVRTDDEGSTDYSQFYSSSATSSMSSGIVFQADPDSSLARLMERLERMESTSDEDLTERASEGTAGRPLKALLPEGAVQTSVSRPVQQRQRPPARQRHHSCNVPIGGHWSGSPAAPGTTVQGRHPHRVALGILPSSIGIGPGGFFIDDYDRFFSSAAQLQQLQRRQPPIGSGHCGRWRHQSMSSICQQVPSTASVVSKASQPPQRRHSSGGCGSRWWHRPLGLNPGPETDARPPLLQQKPPADPAGAVGPRGRPMAENGAKDGAHNDCSGAYSPDNDETDAIKEFSSF